jgi:hypothetical protein
MKKKLNQHLVIALTSAFILVAGRVSFASAESVSVFGFRAPGLCAFKLLTMLDCPGCGLTRSLIYALHGNFSESYAMHIWGIPLMLILLFQIPYRVFRSLKPDFQLHQLPDRIKKWLSPAIFLSLLLPWVVKTIAIAIVRYL